MFKPGPPSSPTCHSSGSVNHGPTVKKKGAKANNTSDLNKLSTKKKRKTNITIAVACKFKEMEKEAKKEAFRKYLESGGVLDALTKVLVALYEQNDKPSSALEFIQQKLGGPTVSEYEKLQAELSDLHIRYDELLKEHQERCRELEELKHTQVESSSKEPDVGNAPDEELKSTDIIKS